MFCPNCGNRLPDDGKTRYCIRCGAPVTETAVPKEHDDFPKSPGAGRTVGVIACLLLLVGGMAGGVYYIAKNGLELPTYTPQTTTQQTVTTAPTETVTTTAETDPQTTTSESTTTTTTTTTAPAEERIDRRFDFVTPNGLDTFVTVHFNKSAYETYHAKPRYYQPDEFVYYINNTVNREVVSAMSQAMMDLAVEQRYTHKELAYMAIRLVQSIAYVTDNEGTGREDYPKYPIETVYEKQGDCEDLSILLVGLLRDMGFETCFVVFPAHVGVGIRLDDAENGTYFEYDGIKYYYVETTAEGWNIGAYPEELTTDAHLYFVK